MPSNTVVAGPVIRTGWPAPFQAMVRSPPWVWTLTGESSRPRRMPATTAAQAPVPQASVSPAPRSNTRSRTVRSVFRSVDPLGIRVVSFKAPTAEELARDYLWRVHAQVPHAGEIALFNRSHYEDVLITRVQGWIDEAECERRYKQIRAYESLLTDTGTTIVKCFLHISKDEQKARLEARIADPQKHWKFDTQDLAERKFWKEYEKAYEAAIAATATPDCPWYIVPSDSKTHRNLMVAEIITAVFRQLKPAYPPPKPELAKLRVE